MAAISIGSFHTGYLLSHFSHNHAPDQSHLDCGIDQCDNCEKNAEVHTSVSNDESKSEVETSTKHYVKIDQETTLCTVRKRFKSLTKDLESLRGIGQEVSNEGATLGNQKKSNSDQKNVQAVRRDRPLSFGDASELGGAASQSKTFNQKGKSASDLDIRRCLNSMFDHLSLHCYEMQSNKKENTFQGKCSNEDSTMSLINALNDKDHPSIQDASWHKFRHTWDDNLNEH